MSGNDSDDNGDDFASGPAGERANGNGSLMRLAPVPLFFARNWACQKSSGNEWLRS
jgi:ADP-ribosylglycohydrolase